MLVLCPAAAVVTDHDHRHAQFQYEKNNPLQAAGAFKNGSPNGAACVGLNAGGKSTVAGALPYVLKR